MDGTRDYHAKRSKSDRERKISYDITYLWSLIYGTNEPIYKTNNQKHRKQTCGCQGGGEGSGMDWEFAVSSCKVLHLEWISNKVLLYSTGNYMLGIDHDGR